MKVITGTAVRNHRIKLGMNQAKFWKKVFVTQSGGSRYENGRPIPKQIQLLLHAIIAGADLRNLVADAVAGRRLRERKKPKFFSSTTTKGTGLNDLRILYGRRH